MADRGIRATGSFGELITGRTDAKSLKYNDDGSLTIYLGNKSPGEEKEANWIPAPPGNFSIWIRAYWPDQAILDGTWKTPVVKIAN